LRRTVRKRTFGAYRYTKPRIVIGSIFARSENLLREGMERVINKEALPSAVKCCKIVSAELGEQIGDYAAVATALL